MKGLIFMRGFLKYYLFTFVTVLILINPQSALLYAKSGLALCSDVLAPALFPFFVCSSLLIYSGACRVVARWFRPVMRPLFNVGGAGAAAFILGIISGYPLGASCACKLYDGGYLSKTECERLLAFCNNSGPLFILGSVGIAVYNSPKIGIMLYLAHIAAALTVGVLFRFYKRGEVSAVPVPIYSSDDGIGEIFQKALASSINSILTVCGAVVFFSVIANIMADLFFSNPHIRPLFLALSELTGGIYAISHLDAPLAGKLILSAAAAGFAGFCVHLQVMGVAAGRGLSLLPYLAGKVLHALLAASYTALLLHFFPMTQTAFAGGSSLSGAFFAASVYTVICTSTLALVAAAITVFVGVRRKISAKKQVAN